MAPIEPLIACVGENRHDWFLKVQNLVLSIRGLGGTLHDARILVSFVDGVDDDFRRPLESLGAEVRTTPRVKLNPFANKLRMLELDDGEDFDVLVAIDCDTVIVGDLSPYLSLEAIRAAPVDYDRLRDAEWRRLFALAGVSPPGRSEIASSSGERIYPCFNSGVLLIPRASCSDLRRHWLEQQARLATAFASEELAVRPQWRLQIGQYALANALLAGRLPFVPLPASLNFPTHVPVHRSIIGANPKPLILHYHADLDSRGFLTKPRSAVAEAPADEFNRLRASRLGIDYEGLARRTLRVRIRRLRRRSFRLLAIRHALRPRRGRQRLRARGA